METFTDEFPTLQAAADAVQRCLPPDLPATISVHRDGYVAVTVTPLRDGVELWERTHEFVRAVASESSLVYEGEWHGQFRLFRQTEWLA